MRLKLSKALLYGLLIFMYGFNFVRAAEHFAVRLEDVPIVSTLHKLAKQHNTNLIIDNSIAGNVSLELTDVNMAELLEAIAYIHDLQLKKVGKVYYLSQYSGKKIDEEKPEAQQNLIATTINLKHAKAEEVFATLKASGDSMLSPSGNISVDKRSNTLLLKDTKESVAEIRRLVKKIDVPNQQLIIEARIVTISNEDLSDLGVRWGLFDPTKDSHRVNANLNSNGFDNLTNKLNINLPAVNIGGVVSFQIAKINSRLLDLELSALERENNVEIIASPKLLTTNKHTASIKQGTEIPYVTTTKDSSNVEFREAVLGLEVTPHISPKNEILLDLKVTQDSVGSQINNGQNVMPTIDKQEINTQVFAKDGETIVLGGIFNESTIKGVSKVPLLGDIPVLKYLFSQKTDRYIKRELVIFVTPYIVKTNQIK